VSLAGVSWYIAILLAIWTLALSSVTVHPRARSNWYISTAGVASASVLFAILGASSRRFLRSTAYYRRGWLLVLYAVFAGILTVVFLFGFLIG
jgi:hypothetical protein